MVDLAMSIFKNSHKNSDLLTPLTPLGVHPQWFETTVWNIFKQFLLLCLWGCSKMYAALKKQDLPSILLFLAVACFLPLLSLLPLSTCWVGRVEEFIVPKSEFLKHFVESHQKMICLPKIYYQSWHFSSKLHNCSHTTQKVAAVL